MRKRTYVSTVGRVFLVSGCLLLGMQISTRLEALPRAWASPVEDCGWIPPRERGPTYTATLVAFDSEDEALNAIEANPQNADLLSDYAFLLSREDRYSAIEQLRLVLRVEPDHARTLARLVYLSHSSTAPEETIRLCERAEAAGWSEGWHFPSLKGGALRRAGRGEEALVVLERALKTYPEQSSLFEGIALTLVDLGRLDEAWYYAQWGFFQSPHYPAPEAIATLSEPSPEMLAVVRGEQMFWQGRAHEDRQEWKRAIDQYTAALEVRFYRQDLTVHVYSQLADVYWEAGQAENSLATLQEGLALFPKSGLLRRGLAKALLNAGRAHEAKQQVLELQRSQHPLQPSPRLMNEICQAISEGSRESLR